MKKTLAVLALLGLAAGISGCWLNALPTAQFTLEPTTGASPLLVTFDASKSTGGDGAIASYVWTFGDGSTGSGVAPAHLYVTEEEREFAVTVEVTDRGGGRASASRTVTVLAPAPPSPEQVEFVWPFHFDADGEDAANLNDEYFTLQNTGDVVVDMSGWTVENERGVSFRFPDGFVLAVGAFVYVHSGAGVDSQEILYWNASEPIWHDTYDIAVLRDADGQIVDVYAYASC
jgi:hypothetical protein